MQVNRSLLIFILNQINLKIDKTLKFSQHKSVFTFIEIFQNHSNMNIGHVYAYLEENY